MNPTDYYTVSQIAELWAVTPRRVQTLIAEGRIPGVVQAAGVWWIPKDTRDPRKDHGRPKQSDKE